MTLVRLEPAAHWSRVKLSTTEPLSHVLLIIFVYDIDDFSKISENQFLLSFFQKIFKNLS